MKKILFVAGILILFISCEENDHYTENSTESLKSYTGKELFKGILFAEGDVADLLQNIKQSYSYYEINQIDVDHKNDSDNKINYLLNSIENKNSHYFDEFKQSITSKDHIRIRQALANGSELVYNTALDLYLSKNEKNDLKNLLSKIDISTYTNENGMIDKEKLKKAITQSNSFSLNQAGKGTCWFAGVVVVAAAYVVVVHAAAAMTYVAVAWVAEAYAAVDQAKTITRSKAAPRTDLMDEPVGPYEIEEELLIDEIVTRTLVK
ncbi:hypothetical protein [Flavobacterium sp. UBA7680]|uniref:hypothetical protein n=1 Tax=Flavobacterium sp. UBA7680 TaxID=1946559 RepID=UPI0025BD323A|nr:hypothetical protein [Flavobacterium sp. UBA7680]